MPNASIPTPEPVKQRKMFGAYGRSVGTHSVAFVSGVNIKFYAYWNTIEGYCILNETKLFLTFVLL